ncbi:MAG: DHH family phosphoesterase [Spirochaetales bacterium]|nr:DHH family phosphoesterase [Spirochaetales bacterium]MCF7938054.1 DHH family phosphoesterase [Spirochaetales bacterium]
MSGLGPEKLFSLLDRDSRVLVQTHDYPDHDAVAAAFGMFRLLDDAGYTVIVCYGGLLQSASLRDAVVDFQVPLERFEEVDVVESDQIIIVDGFLGNKNVSSIGGRVIGVIDHHPPPWEPTVPYADIRTEYGACASIIYEYLAAVGTEFERNLASILLMGIMMDTAYLTRGVEQQDLDAFYRLYQKGDWNRGSYLLKNALSIEDLGIFRKALDSLVLSGDFAYVVLEDSCNQEVSGILADFFLNLREIRFVVLVYRSEDGYNLSVRSNDPYRAAGIILKQTLGDIGQGGGHIHMGGGVIPADAYPGNQQLRSRFLEAGAGDTKRSGTRKQENTRGTE